MTRSRGRCAPLVLALAAVSVLAAAPGAEARLLILKSSGRTVTVKAGDRVEIDVAENPSTGYAWRPTSKPAFLKLKSSKYTAPAAAPGVVGGGGRHVFVYKTLRAGSGRLKLVYERSFAPSPKDKKFVVKIVVKH